MRWLPLIAALSCGYETAARVITPADIGDADKTRVTAYLSAPARAGSPTEAAPAALARTTVADEATIVQARSDEVCFTLLTRTEARLDVPLPLAQITLDGVKAQLKDERLTVRDYDAAGNATTVMEDEEPLKDPPPSKANARVFERKVSGCAKMAGLPSEIVLEVRLPQKDGKGDWGERFAWNLRTAQ